MCRIAGIISPNHHSDSIKKHISSMTEIQKHGGPDGEGVYFDAEAGLAFGHRRLSLLDLSDLGRQPMSTADENYTIVFNGEIYNFIEIRNELKAHGFSFISQSDTEVVLKAYIAWGTRSFSKLRGMFAFAIYDKANNEVILVRDSQGVKPLYYYLQNDQLIFASEVKAFKDLPIKLTDNPDWPVYFLSFGHLPEPVTTYSEVNMLPKGHYLRYHTLTHKTIPYSSYIQEESFGDLSSISITEAQQLVDELLHKAIRQQLVADAPIGVFLSGGIDSSLLALQASKYQQENLITVSLHFPEAQFSEKSFQQLISDKLPGQHISQEITHKDFETYFDEIVENMDQPGVDGINSWFVSKAASNAGLKAVLSGVGADELFGGYPSFQRISKIPIMRIAAPLAQLIAKLTGKDSLQRVTYLQNRSHSAYEYLFLRGFFTPIQLQQYFGMSNKSIQNSIAHLAEPHSPAIPAYNGKRASWYELNYFMQNQLLKDADTMSMQHGLEIRVPFLDESLVTLVKNLPADILYKKGLPAKHLLIGAFQGILPREIWDRPKMGFTFPFQQWIKRHPRYLELKEKYRSTPKFSFFEAYDRDQIHWSKIMSLMVLEKFHA